MIRSSEKRSPLLQPEVNSVTPFENSRGKPSSPVNDPSRVPTVILCDNSILRLGLSHLLSKTSFHVLDIELDHASLPPSAVSETVALIIVTAGADTNEASRIVEQLKGKGVAAKVVVLADHVEPGGIARAFRAGADGMLVSTTKHEALIKSLELIMLGERLFPAAALLDMHHYADPQQGAQSFGFSAAQPRENAPPLLKSLSERELEVLSRLTKGAQDKVIARDLNLAEATVKVHVKSLLKKLGAQNRTQAAVLASSYLP